jgi:hypothetical protein
MSPTALVGLTWTESYKCSATKHRFQAACPLPSSVRGEGAKGGISGTLTRDILRDGGLPPNILGAFAYTDLTHRVAFVLQLAGEVTRQPINELRREMYMW